MAGKRNADGSVTLKTTGRTGPPGGSGKPQRKAPLAKGNPSADPLMPKNTRIVGKREASS